jgi:nucleotide-binding universal stress UspA family protein
MRTAIAGYDGSEQGRDAVALGEALAGSLDAQLVVACVHPPQPRTSAIGPAGFDRETREGALRTAQSARDLLARPNEASFRAVLGTTAAAGLTDLAYECVAVAVVVGSSHRGRIGRALVGSVARDLLGHAPCPVAVAPAGYARDPGPWSGRPCVGVAFDGSPPSDEAMHLGEYVAARTGGRLLVLSVAESDADAEPLRARLDDVVAVAPVSVHAQGALRRGDVVGELASASDELDVLVCGARGLGPVRRLVLGSVSAGLIERAHCPLLITPAA